MSTSYMKMVIQPAIETLCVSDILHLGQWTMSNIMFVTGMFCGLFTSGNYVHYGQQKLQEMNCVLEY